MKLTPGQEAAAECVKAALDAGDSAELKTAITALSKESHIAGANKHLDALDELNCDFRLGDLYKVASQIKQE